MLTGLGVGTLGPLPQSATLQQPSGRDGLHESLVPEASHVMSHSASGTSPKTFVPVACRKVRFWSRPSALRLPAQGGGGGGGTRACQPP